MAAFYEESTTKICTACDFTCTMCTGPNINDCESCISGKFLHTDGTCVDNCPALFYKNISTYLCINCVAPCLECTALANGNCLSC